jgi:hypothetical protein
MIKIVQGFRLRYSVSSPDCQLVIKGDNIKYIVDTIETVDNTYWIVADKDMTKEWVAGDYKYQILNAEGIESEGDFYIMRNFALADEDESVKSANERYLEAIEAQLAGKATSAQASMSVGDKSISYCTIAELLQLKDYYAAKVAKEQKKFVAGNQGKIIYKWSVK